MKYLQTEHLQIMTIVYFSQGIFLTIFMMVVANDAVACFKNCGASEEQCKLEVTKHELHSSYILFFADNEKQSSSTTMQGKAEQCVFKIDVPKPDSDIVDFEICIKSDSKTPDYETM